MWQDPPPPRQVAKRKRTAPPRAAAPIPPPTDVEAPGPSGQLPGSCPEAARPIWDNPLFERATPHTFSSSSDGESGGESAFEDDDGDDPDWQMDAAVFRVPAWSRREAGWKLPGRREPHPLPPRMATVRVMRR